MSYESARRYLQKVPEPAKGQRNDTLNTVAFCVAERFEMSEHQFCDLMSEWAEGFRPPLSEVEVTKTIRSAWNSVQERGTIGTKGKRSSAHSTRNGAGPKPSSNAPAQKSIRYRFGDDPGELPTPIADGTRALLRLAFASGEGIRIVPARLASDGHEIPDSAGIVLTREEWLGRLDEREGDPNRIFVSSERTGIYIGINPMAPDGRKDADVRAWRHALIEFDSIPIMDQWSLYNASGVPCTAIIHSGGKSLHAWVRVDASTRSEYEERVKVLYDHFGAAGYEPDRKNRNPSRLSRLPNCMRFGSRQELIAIGIGAESWVDWVKKRAEEQLGPSVSFADAYNLDPAHDPGCVIGMEGERTLRYLCRGKGAWIIGPSGAGKSSLTTEFAIGWALGRSVFGLTPVRPLKSLVIQAENDEHDIAEMAQGIARAYDINPFSNEADFEVLSQNVRFRTEVNCTNRGFIERLQRFIEHDKPDIVWCDPFLSFAGIDVTRQDQCTQFLREWLNPVLDATGAVLIGVHHTGKPKSNKDTRHWTEHDYDYSGLGSSELVNWPRAIMVLVPHAGGVYELKMAKRGNRAGAKTPQGDDTRSVWLRHSARGIRWEQIEEPAQQELEPSRSKGGRPSDIDRCLKLGLGPFIDKLGTTPMRYREACLELAEYVHSRDPSLEISDRTAERILTRLKANNAIIKTDSKLWTKV